MPLSLEEAYQKVVSEMGPIESEPGGYMSLDEAYEHVMSQPEFAPLREEESLQRRTESRYTRPSSYDDNEFTLADVGTYASDLWNAGISGAQGGMANLSDAVGYVANKIGMDSLRDTAHGWARNWESDAQNRMRNVVDPEGFGNRVASGMGSSLTMMIPGAAVAAAGAASGGALPGLLGLAAGGAIGLSEAAGTAGGVYRSLKDRELSEDEANRASNRLFLTEAPLDILSESALGFLPGARAMKGVIKNPVLRSMAGEAVQEALQETYQGLLQPAAENSARGDLSDYLGALWNEGRNAPEVFMREGLPAAVSGALMGGAGTVVTNRGFSTPSVEIPKPETAGTVPGNVAPQMPEKMSDVFKPVEPQPVIPETAKPLPGAMPAAETPVPTGKKAEAVAAANMQKVAEIADVTPAVEQPAQKELIPEDTDETLDDLRAQMAEEYQNLRQMDAEERENLPPSTLSGLMEQSGRRYEQSPNVQDVIGRAPERDMMIAGEKGAKDVIKKKDQDVVNVGGRNIRVREMPLSVPDFRAIPSDRAVEIAKSKLRELIKRGDIRSEAGLTAHFKERPGTDFDYYFNHLTRGDKKKNGTQEAEILRTQQGSLIDPDGVWGPMQRERLAALWLAEDTIKHPNLGIYQPDRNTRMLASIYHAPDRIKGQGNFGDYVIVAVDPNGGNVVVTSFSTQDSRSKKNRTLRYLNQQLEKNEGSVEYVEDLSRADGALPPTVGAMRSSESAFLPQSDTQTIPQNLNSDNRDFSVRGDLPLGKESAPERGDFGPIWRGYEGEAAVEKLLEERQGEVVGAMSDPRLGENSSIDFVWGQEGDPQKGYKGGYGFAHIKAKHGDKAVQAVPQIIRTGSFALEKTTNSAIYISAEGKVILQRAWKHAPKNWVLTSYLPDTKKGPRPAQDVQIGGQVEESLSSSSEGLSNARIPQSSNGSNRDFSVHGSLPQVTVTASPESESTGTLIRIKDIYDKLRKIAPVRKGVSAPANVAGYYTPETDVARERHWGDFPTALHEIGHALDYKLGLRESVRDAETSRQLYDELCELGKATAPQNVNTIYERLHGCYMHASGAEARGPDVSAATLKFEEAQRYLMKEGIAEFFRGYAYNPDLMEVVAPEYTKLFREALEAHEEYRQPVGELFDAIRGYNELTPEQKLRAGMIRGDEKVKNQKGARAAAAEAWNGFRQKFDDQLRYLEQMQNLLRDRVRDLAKEHGGRYADMLQHGELKEEFAVYDMLRTMPGYMGKAKRDVLALMEPVKKLGDEAYAKLTGYMKALRALDYWDNGLEPGIGLTRAEVSAVVNRTRHENPELARIAEDIAKAYEAMVERTLIDSGVWSRGQYEEYKKRWPHYVPFVRVNEDGAVASPTRRGKGIVNLSNQVKQTTGVGTAEAVVDTKDPFEMMVKNALVFNQLAEKNRAAQALVRAALADPALFADVIEPVQGGERSGDTFTVWFDGKRRAFTGDKKLIDALAAMEQAAGIRNPIFGSLDRAAQGAANLLKLGATRANPAFILTNFIRDAMYSSLTNSARGARSMPFFGTVKGLLMQTAKDDASKQRIADALDHGLAYSGITELGLNASEKGISKYVGKAVHGDKGFLRKLASAWDNTIGKYNEMVELAPKFAEYERLVKEGYPKRYAARMAREVNLDFSRGGQWGKVWNRYTAFFNPAVQGTSKLVRTAAAHPGRFAARTAMYVILPSLISWMAGRDDDEYKRISRNIKDRYWVFKVGGTWLRLPKPELAGMFGSAVERVLDAAFEHDPMAFRELGRSVWEGFSPNLLPTFAEPILEHRMGKTFFYDSPLIPPQLENLPPELQFTKNTSSMAKFLGKAWGVSPILIDHYVSSYGGGVGEYLSKVPDIFLKPQEEAKKLSEKPLFSRFTVDPNRNSESLAKFYDLRRQATVAKNAYDVRRKMGEQPEYSAGVHMAKAFDQAARKLSDWRKDIAAIQQSKSMTPERKREVIDRIRLRMNQEAEAAVGSYFTVKEKLDRRKR
ncbi:LPD38 domain-containing protein [Pyramidobacter piscolens]|uniref:LPD38 domain-containing protein n=1 Tax=Pyramidobacter piscolens TaxID=638849 RepID=UPI002AB0EB67|nr:LPD38 domain-containing protein [Pyramidobacter piscolens]